MNKKDIINAVSENAGTTKVVVEKVLNSFQDVVIEALKSGNDVNFTGFFAAKKKHRAARTGRNPQTGAPINIPASNVITMKPGAVLKDSVK
jgi:DNA-binding protein HU-beta